MGVAASLSVSILRNGRLWGLFACHHTEPRHISLERRTGANRAYATDEIGRVHEPGRDFTERAAGMLAVPVSRTPRDFLVFFR